MFTHFTHFPCWSSHKSLQEFVKFTSSSATSKGNTKMASSSIFSAPFLGFTQTKPKPNPNASWVCSSMASSHKSSFGSSKSAFFQHGFSLKSPNFSGFVLKPRSSATVYARAATEKTIYDFTVKDIDGNDVSLNKFKGKVLLIVNVASKCGLTSSNYSELSHIYEKYKTQGFEILAFPCNQFGGQEPGSNPEIKQFACTRFKAEFPIFDKVDVNGPNTAPVYQFLKSTAGGFLGDLVKWNFEKFLVDKNGKVVERYQPTTSPLQIEIPPRKSAASFHTVHGGIGEDGTLQSLLQAEGVPYTGPGIMGFQDMYGQSCYISCRKP